MFKPNERRAIAEFEAELRKKLPEYIRLLELFGSKARGKGTDSSDIDVLVLTEGRDFEKNREICGTALDLSIEYDTYISAKILDITEFERLKQLHSSFARNIEKDGKILWRKS